MSMHHIEQIKCPKCGKTADYEIWESVNVNINPEMREKVLSEELFNFNCPHCGHEEKLGFPFLYNDAEHNFMVYYCSEEDVEDCKSALNRIIENAINSDDELIKEATLKNRYRIVTNYIQLIEKIKIFESGFDDRLIELIKLTEIIDLNKNKPENNLSFAFYDLLVNPNAKKKGPVPTLVFFNKDCEHTFDFDLTFLPGLIHKVRDSYDYSDDRSFIIDVDWANKYINGERLDHSFFDVDYDENNIDDEGARLAYALVNLPDDDTSSHYFISLSNDEQDATVAQSGVELEELKDILKAFYRYTNFHTILRDLKKPDFHETPRGVFRMNESEELEFYRDYFIEAMSVFEEISMYYIKLLIHGGRLDPNHPLPYGVNNREEGPFGMYRTLENLLTEDPEETRSNLQKLYEANKDEEFSKGLKKAIIIKLAKFDIPKDDKFKIEPTLGTDQTFKLFDYLMKLDEEHRHGLSLEEFYQKREVIVESIPEIWKVCFDKKDVAKCFEYLARYFYDKQMYREAYLNQAFCSAYVPNNFGFMYIKKQYKSEITSKDIDEYKEKYNLPIFANLDLEEEIFNLYKSNKESGNYNKAIYYLNLCYNFYGENDNTAKKIDTLIDGLLDEISL